MINDALGIVITVLLLILVMLVATGNFILAFIAGMGFRMPKRKKHEQEELEEIELIQNPNGPGYGSVSVPHSKLPEFLSNIAKAARESAAAGGAGEIKENEKKNTHTPSGYL